jgi:hypothetical protein
MNFGAGFTPNGFLGVAFPSLFQNPQVKRLYIKERIVNSLWVITIPDYGWRRLRELPMIV